MKFTPIVLVVALSATLFGGCATSPAPRLVYKESQFASRLEYLRFCQTNELLTRRCD